MKLERKVVSVITLALLLASMLTLAFEIQQIRAAGGIIYIRADGSIDPPAAPISTVDNVTYTFTGNIYDSITVERDNVIIDGAGYTLQGTGTETGMTGIRLPGRTNVTVQNTEIKNNYVGITIYSSSNYNNISGNTVADNYHGIMLSYFADHNSITGNNITANIGCGILFDSSSGNSVSRNSIRANGFSGIALQKSSDYNSISGNAIADNEYGIWLHSIGGDCSNNRFYHNNLINNSQQVVVLSLSVNFWDDGYPSGGNYWGDYSGVDLYHGEGQDVPSSDGIGDTPYVIDSNNRDRYPLVDCWVERRVGVQVGDWVRYGDFVVAWSSEDPRENPPRDYDFWKSIQCIGTTAEIVSGTCIVFEFVVYLGNGTEESNIFDIDVDTGEGFGLYFVSAGLSAGYSTYAGGIGYSPGPEINETISIEYLGALRETNHLNLTRFYSDFGGWKNYRESYNLYWDRITGVLTEYSYQRSFLSGNEDYMTSHLTSFRIVDSNIWRVRILGDLNGDNNVDIKDLARAGQSFGSYPDHQRWNIMADLNQDEKVDIRDLVLIAKNFGKTYP